MSLIKDVLNRKLAFDFLTSPDERKELRVLIPEITEPVKLKYVGKQKTPWGDERLWNIKSHWHPFHESTRTIEGLKELGIV